MEQVERKHRLIAVGQRLVVGVQVPGSHAEHESDRAPTGYTPHDLIQDVRQGEGLVTGEWIVAQGQGEKTYSAEEADEPQGEADPSVSLESAGEAFIGRNDVADDEVDRVPEEIGPASLSFEEPSESDERQSQR